MALFQKNPFTTTKEKSLYTLGLNKSILIVGLGNVGKSYEQTRHNIGFACADAFAASQDFPDWIQKKDLKCLLTSKTLGATQVILVKPTTMMNLSGEAVQAVMRFYRVEPHSTLVVHDEYDVPFGTIRTRLGGSHAGHNGIKSLIQHIGEDFGRVRIGIQAENPDKMDMSDYVLAKFSKEEQAQLPNLHREVVSVLTEYAYSGSLNHETRNFIT